MSAELEQHLRTLAVDGVRMHIWPCEGGFQANIAEQGTQSWTCVTRGDAVDALLSALRQFISRVPDRRVEVQPEQWDGAYTDDLSDQWSAEQEALALGDEIGCVICENGGCDACRAVAADPLSDMFG